jgi:nitroreductase
MSAQRWIDALWRIPPRYFWSTLIHFVCYGWRQAIRATARDKPDPSLASHLNFKRAHYLEKAMLCEYPKSAELDASFGELRRYVESEGGADADCNRYLRKMLSEYGGYPESFRCYMLQVPKRPWPQEYAQILRRVILQRRSIRRFSDKTVATGLLEKIVEAGSWAPTSCNAQALSFLTLTSRDALQLVFGGAAGARDWKNGIPAGILVLADGRHYKPFRQHIVMYQDIAAATQNCLLMAEALGLGACWVSLLTDSHMDAQSGIYDTLSLPPHMVVGAAIALGHPENAVCLVPRRPLSSVWHSERYRSS